MKSRSFVWSTLMAGAIALAFAWLLITPALGARAGAAASAVMLKTAPATAQQAKTVSLARTIDITFTPAFTGYLPLVHNAFPPPPAGIYGTVTYQGVPIDGLEIQLQLCRHIGNSWTCSSGDTRYTNTQWGGRYQFTTAASLAADYKYVVKFNNSTNDERFLSSWYSFSLYTYASGEVMAGGDFDVADMVLLAPPAVTNSSLPVTFEWQRRVGSPSDSYRLELFKPNESIMFSTPRLGYEGSYTMNSLPSGFTTGVQYGWYVWVYGPGDSVGYTNEYHWITFH